MKNVIQWIIGLVVVVGLTTIFIIRLASGDSVTDRGLRYNEELNTIKKQRDSIQVALKQSILREQQWILKHEADSVKADSLTIVISNREKKIKTYEERLREVRQITITNPDSFLIKRYPKTETHR